MMSATEKQGFIERKIAGMIWGINSPDELDALIDYVRTRIGGPLVRGGVDRGPLPLPQQRVGSAELPSGVKRLKEIVEVMFRKLGPIAVAVEPNHVDAVYRDAFYYCYSRHISNSPRFTLRLSFFEGAMDGKSFHEIEDDELQDAYRGSLTMYPINGGIVGTTRLVPATMVEKSARIRMASFRADVFGRTLSVEAFPYRMQDTEMMTCAEVTVINLLDYYAASYGDYASVLPSRLIELEEQELYQRALPARGITYARLSQVLGRLGFYPRLLSRRELSGSDPALDGRFLMRRNLCWYVSSGIPVAVNVEPAFRKGDGHSLIAIGFESWEKQFVEGVRGYLMEPPLFGKADMPCDVQRAVDSLEVSCEAIDDGRGDRYRLYLEADIPRKLVVIDDEQTPYAVREYDRMVEGLQYSCENIVIPLHRSMALDAQGAYSVVDEILQSESLGLARWGVDYLHAGEAVILRMSLLTAARYREHRRKGNSYPLDRIYETLALPHFVWLVELVRASDYKADDSKAFAEIVLDATAGRKREAIDVKLIAMRYPGRFVWREPEDDFDGFGDHALEWNADDPNLSNLCKFPAYSDSLRTVS